MIQQGGKSILIVDDEPSICWGFEQMLRSEGHAVSIASSSEEGLGLAGQQPFDLVVLDVRLPGEDGISALPKFRAAIRNAPVVIMTAFGDLATAVEAVRQGASDYLTKPFELDEALRVCREALRTPVVAATDEVTAGENVPPAQLVGSSARMQKLYRQIAIIADSDLSVLILGETGSGKELVARAVVQHSARHAATYLAVAPVAFSESLIESELFGHAQGAFTGAAQERAGIFEMADGGTVLLDEIGDLSEAVQVKLLRVLEQGEFTRVGDVRPRRCNVRVLAATNRDLQQLVQEGRFRQDLYYRLSAAQVEVPPLRDRLDDLPDLVHAFLRQMGHNDPDPMISEAFLDVLRARRWEGNVRELRNVVEHAAVVARGRPLMPEHIPAPQASLPNRHAPNDVVREWAQLRLGEQPQSGTQDLYEEFLAAFEPGLLATVLEATGGNRAAAAERLGIHRGTLRDRLRKYEID